MTDTVRDFLRLHVAAVGGVVEERGAGLDALLPPEAAAALGVPEEVHLALDETLPSAGAAAVDARLGSPLIERAVSAWQARRPVATVALPAELPRSLPEDVPVLLNAVRAGPVGPRTRVATRYLVAHVRLRLQGDEVRTVLLEVAVRLPDGALVSAPGGSGAYPVAPAVLDTKERQAADRAVRAACARRAPAVLASALDAIARRACRDLGRIAEYYASLDAEMARAVQRARSPDEQARRLAKRRMLPAELAARRAQLRDRLLPRLGTELVAAVVVETETDRWTVPVRRRTLEVSVVVHRRAADGALEGPACAGCRAATGRFHLCDERGHPLCEACGRPGRLAAARCPGCRPRPPVPLALSVEDPTVGLRLGGDAG